MPCAPSRSCSSLPADWVRTLWPLRHTIPLVECTVSSPSCAPSSSSSCFFSPSYPSLAGIHRSCGRPQIKVHTTSMLRGLSRATACAAAVALRTETRALSSAALCATRLARGSAQPPLTSPAVGSLDSKAPAASDRGATGGSADPPVSPLLLQELKSSISRCTPLTWMSVSDLYADLSPEMRRQHVRPHKSMLGVLKKVAPELGITLSPTGVFYAVGKMSIAPAVVNPKPVAKVQKAHHDAPAKPSAPAASLPKPAEVDELKMQGYPPVDFFFDVNLLEYPPPPADSWLNTHTLPRHVRSSSADGSVISMRDFISYIPPFFVPVQEVLAHMPGYTEEHLRHVTSTRTMETVTLNGQSYIRLFGGYEKLSLVGCQAAEERFVAYRPPPQLVEKFVAGCREGPERWIPLTTLLERVDPAVVAQLPYSGTEAVMYFAQMQHRFAFATRQVPSPHGSGPPITEAAVLLRRSDFCGLDDTNTPTPKLLSYAFTKIPSEGQVEMSDVERQLPTDVLQQAVDYYGSFAAFLRMHAPIFFIPPETPTVVMRLRYQQRMSVVSLPLEEQVELAKKAGKKAKMRILRRRIAFRDNPSHPFLDPENYARELSKFLPRRGFVSVKRFVGQVIPEELLLFMPPKMFKFFDTYPQFFTQFEYQKPGSWCLCRPDQPLPRGVIRKDYDEADMVRIIAEYVQKAGPLALSNIILNMPRGAQAIVKKRYGSLYHFVIRYPQYFHVVVGSDNENAQSSAVLHLTQVPSTELRENLLAASAEAPNNPHAPSTGGSKGAGDGSGPKRSSSAYDDDDDDDDYDGLD